MNVGTVSVGIIVQMVLVGGTMLFAYARWGEEARAQAKAVGALERLSAHGLRAGFVTAAYQAGARDEQIMAHTRHRDLRTMRGYVRRAKLLTESPVKLLGL